MRIGIDAHVIGTRAGGNETYMRDLLEALRAHAPEADLTVFVTRGTPPQAAGLRAVAVPVRSSYLRVPIVLPWLARREGIGVLHVQYTAPPWLPCPYVVSMHDIVALRFPESMPFLDRHRLRLLSPRTLRNAARIFVLTAAIREEIAETYHIPRERFDLVQPPADPLFRPIVDEEAIARVRRRYELPRDYLLYVGLLQPRKNLVRLARAFAGLEARGLDHKLVIVGKRAWLYREMLEEIHALGLSDRIAFTGYVGREDLPVLYSQASAFAFLSLYEGFGIPVLEALACGVPVLASTDPAIVEVADGAALHVDPYDTSAIECALYRILTDQDLRRRLAAAGPRRAAAFTGEHMARAAMEGYQKALD